jgi:hypothetical protein
VSLGITWAGSRRFEIAVLNVNLQCKEAKDKYKWNFQEHDIKLFRNLCHAEELYQFDKAVEVIPEYAVLGE